MLVTNTLATRVGRTVTAAVQESLSIARGPRRSPSELTGDRRYAVQPRSDVPTDAKLLNGAREKLVQLAQRHGVDTSWREATFANADVGSMSGVLTSNAIIGLPLVALWLQTTDDHRRNPQRAASVWDQRLVADKTSMSPHRRYHPLITPLDSRPVSRAATKRRWLAQGRSRLRRKAVSLGGSALKPSQHAFLSLPGSLELSMVLTVAGYLLLVRLELFDVSLHIANLAPSFAAL